MTTFLARTCAFALLLVVNGIAQGQPADPAGNAGVPLSWRLENPFRLFRDARDFDKFRMQPGESVQDWFARHAHAISGDYLPARRTWWDPEDGLNRSGQYEPGYVRPSSHRVVLGWKGLSPEAVCDWGLFYPRSDAAQTDPKADRTLRGPCREVVVDVPFRPEADGQAGQPVRVQAKDRATQRTAETTVRVRDLLILGLGDSYSAGEGSPDRPAKLTRRDSELAKLDPFPAFEDKDRWVWMPQVTSGRAAGWWDEECHRSLLSWQVLSALKLASDDANAAAAASRPVQTAVTFLSYACSGAEIEDGLLHPQGDPPGTPKAPDANGAGPVQRGQLHAASVDLCEHYGSDSPWLGRDTNRNRWIYQRQCANQRVPDVVLLSIGGNDAGFAKVIMNTLVPKPEQGNSALGTLGLRLVHSAILGTVTPDEAQARVKALQGAYPRVSNVMQQVLGVNPARVVFMQYPNPVLRPSRLRGAPPNNPYCGVEMRAGMEAARFLNPALRMHWHMWGTQAEFAEVASKMVGPLHQAIRSSTAPWRIAEHHLKDFEEHGLCADAVMAELDSQDEPATALPENVAVYGLPRQASPQLEPAQPYHFDHAYNPALQRWIRTPNDSVQVQAHSQFARGMTGAFHPTGSGYARMADSAYEEIRVLVEGSR